MSHIFLSYSHKDQEYTQKLVEELRNKGIEVWFDKDSIRTGDQWSLSIKEAVQASSAMVVIMTPSAKQSSWVREEIGVALSCAKPIFPLLLKGTVFTWLSDLQYLDISGGQLPSEKFFSQLSEIIRGKEFAEPNAQQNKNGENKTASKARQTTDSSDVLILKKLWQYLKTGVFAQLGYDLPNGYLDWDFVGSVGDEYLVMRQYPEYQLYDQDIENALQVLDASIRQLFSYTGRFFSPDVGGSRLTIHVTGYVADPETGFRIAPSDRKASKDMLEVANKVLINHRNFLQILQEKHLLHEIAWCNQDG